MITAREYKITCTVPGRAEVSSLLARLPSPIHRAEMREIYNYSVLEDGFYFIDHLVDAKVASAALGIFVHAALACNRNVTVTEISEHLQPPPPT